MDIKELYKYNLYSNFNNNIENSIYNVENFNKKLNCLCQFYKDEFLKNSEIIKEKIKNNTQKDLAGMIISIKDLICYQDHPVSASSKILEGFISNYNSTVVERILTNDGLIIGHTNCDEFGMGGSNENSIYGPVHNLLDINKTSGGSSGGSAVSVQSNMCHISLGTDTGGSIRQPASYCNIIGFKPSYGRISRYGIISHASSFDVVGILGKNINDIEDIFEVISGYDNFDHSLNCDKYVKNKDIDVNKKYKIAVLDNAINIKCIQKEVKEGILKFIDNLSNEGHDIENITFNNLEYSSAMYFTLTTIEACTNLSRYNGVNYGYRADNYKSFDEMIIKTRTEGFGDEVKKRLLMGNYLFETNKKNRYIDKANKLREEFKDAFKKIFEKYDFIILPVTTTTAFNIGEKCNEDNSEWDDIVVTLASLVGYPAISIPCGFDNNNMPFGIQIIGNIYKENSLFYFLKK